VRMLVEAPPPPPPPVVPPPPPKFPIESFENYLKEINREPGMAILKFDMIGDSKVMLQGKRDPFSTPPEQLKQRVGFDKNWIEEQWTEAVSTDSAIIAKKVSRIIQSVPTLRYQVEANRVVMEGTVDPARQKEITRRILLIPGVLFVNEENIRSN